MDDEESKLVEENENISILTYSIKILIEHNKKTAPTGA